MLLYGLIFALLRWRAGANRRPTTAGGSAAFAGDRLAPLQSETGGILGLVIVHGLIDFLAAQMLPSIDVVGLGRPEVPQPWMLAAGLALIVGVPLGLWWKLKRAAQ
jgi:hypothetical protein